MGDGVQNLRNSVFQSFQTVRSDIESLKIRLLLLETENSRLREELRKKDISEEIRKSSENESVSEQSQSSLTETELRRILNEIVGEALKHENTKAPEPVSEVGEIITSENIGKKPRADRLTTDVIKTLERNRRDIIKNNILAEIKKGSLTKVDLRDVVVEQKQYCSKASFYRYLEELEHSELIRYQRRHKKLVIEAVLELTP